MFKRNDGAYYDSLKFYRQPVLKPTGLFDGNKHTTVKFTYDLSMHHNCRKRTLR